MTPSALSVIETIRRQGSSNGSDLNLGLAWELDLSRPYLATAIHAGHHVRDEILPLMALSPDQIRREEDVATERMISGLSNAVWGLESRAVYDLNRPPDLALPLSPEKFWGVRVYDTQPTPAMNDRSLAGYTAFYRFVEACVDELLDRFGYCIIYDFHSYNRIRQQDKGIADPPVFNLGTALLDRSVWLEPIQTWLDCLKKIQLPGQVVTTAENLVFSGKGEFCRRLTHKDRRILVLPTEISKFYMDERTGDVDPLSVNALKQGLTTAVLDHMDRVGVMRGR